MTGRDLVSASMRLIGTLASGEVPATQEASDGLSALNRMIASWSTESLMINAKVRESFALIPGQQAYTMGTAGNFNTSRPQRIEAALIQVIGTSPLVEIPMDLLNLDQFSDIVVKSIQSTIPRALYAEGTYPLETLNIWPVPSVANNLILYSWKQLAQIATLDTVLAFPPGYEEALVYNLAVRLAPEYGKQTAPEVSTIATESKATLKRMNHRPQYLQVDPALQADRGVFNWLTGDFR